MIGCPSCAKPLPEGARFCPACGYSVVASGPAEERRVVTVLFADVVGFATLAEHRDPERVKRLVDAVFERMTDDVESFGGRVDKVLGDAIVALFGAPVAHEDDAERAVRTGLRLHETLRQFMSEQPIDVDGEMSVSLRVGINTGEVLVGSVAGTEYTAMGDVVNTASRLQALAPPGGVLVGDATRSLCSDSIVFESLEPTLLRGRDQVEQLWLVSGVDSPAKPRRSGVRAAFVGRELERQALWSVLHMVNRGRGAIMSITGEPGIGKSRLVDETVLAFREMCPDLVVLEGACPPYGESNVWAPLSAAIATYYGIERSHTAAEVRSLLEKKFEHRHQQSTDAEARQEVEAFMHLLGHPSALDRLDPAGARDVLFSAVIAGVRRRAARGPVVLWLDDLQWAHALMLELLQVIARSVTDLPVLIATASRPGDDGEWTIGVERTISLRLPLGPLDIVEAKRLIREISEGRSDAELADHLYERSGGNPLFLTELTLLAADGAADERGAELPGTLRALIAARLDQLGASERAVIDNASILGSEGPTLALAEFAAALDQMWDPADLDALSASGLIELTDGWWRFGSDVVREVAYQTLTKQARAQRHAGVASVMSGYDPAPLDEMAHHAACAAELLAELGLVPGVSARIRPWAIEMLAAATRRSFDMGAFRAGLASVERALVLEVEDPSKRRPLLLLRAEGYVEVHRLGDARLDLAAVLDGARRDGDRIAEGEAYRLLGSIERLDGDLVAARRQLGTAVDIFRELEDHSRLALALRVRGYAEVFGGSLQDAEWYLGESDALYQSLGDERGRAWVAQHRSWVSFLSGEHAEAEQRLRAAIATFEEIGDHSGVNWSRGLLAFVLYLQRRFDEADALAAEVMIEARRWGDEWGAAMMMTLASSLRMWTGQFAEALHFGEKALAGFRRIGDPFGALQAMAPLNRARVALGRASDAERGIEEILSVADSFGGLAFPSLASSGVAMHLGDGARTVDLATEALERMALTGSVLDEARIQLALGHLQCGRPEAALAALLEIEVERFPFALGVRAVAHAAIGDFAAAIADADSTDGCVGSSYFDQALAAMAAAAASNRQGAIDQGQRLEHLEQLTGSTGDVVIGAVLRAAVARLSGMPAAVTGLPAGWACVVDLLMGTVPVPA